jgi:hypothetical protein
MVREATVEALRVVYAAHADTQKLTNFSQRFKGRVLEMADDKDEAAAAAAVGLCLHLAQIADVLAHDEVVKLYERTTDSRPRVRAAAARFANDYFLESVVPENIGADEDLQESQIKALVELVVEFTSLPENPAYVVDALFSPWRRRCRRGARWRACSRRRPSATSSRATRCRWRACWRRRRARRRATSLCRAASRSAARSCTRSSATPSTRRAAPLRASSAPRCPSCSPTTPATPPLWPSSPSWCRAWI